MNKYTADNWYHITCKLYTGFSLDLYATWYKIAQDDTLTIRGGRYE